MSFVERVNQGESLASWVNWLTVPPAVCWSVIMGDLSATWKGVYWTLPKAFRMGPQSCAVHSMDRVLVIGYMALISWKYWWLYARLWYLQCTGNGSICSLVLSYQYICYNKNFIWFTYVSTKVLFAMASKGECLLLWEKQDQLGGQWSVDQNIWA